MSIDHTWRLMQLAARLISKASQAREHRGVCRVLSVLQRCADKLSFKGIAAG